MYKTETKACTNRKSLRNCHWNGQSACFIFPLPIDTKVLGSQQDTTIQEPAIPHAMCWKKQLQTLRAATKGLPAAPAWRRY